MIEMELVNPEKQFQLFFDDVRLPADALIGDEDAGLAQLFAGLNPERIMASATAVGLARFALGKAVDYVKERTVWKAPLATHQAISHPLAQCKIEIEMAKLMMQKAAVLYDAGDDWGAAEAANMSKYAAGEACVKTVDQAVHSLGGNGLTVEYGLASAIGLSRVTRIAPVSREMILISWPRRGGFAEVVLRWWRQVSKGRRTFVTLAPSSQRPQGSRCLVASASGIKFGCFGVWGVELCGWFGVWG